MNTTDTTDLNASNRTQSDVEYLEFERLVSLIVPAVFGCIVILGIIGNSLVIYTVWSRGRKRSITDILIFNLAVADLGFVIICVPTTAYQYSSTRWALGDIGCKISQYFIYVSVYVSIYTLVLMAVSRYLAIVHPISSLPYRTRKNTTITLAILWCVVLTAHIPLLQQYGIYRYDHHNEERIVCINHLHYRSSESTEIFFLMFFVFGFCFPSTIISVLYGLILVRILFHKVPGAAVGNRPVDRERLTPKIKAAKMVLILIVVFILCWLPNHVVFMIQNFGDWPYDVHYIILQFAANIVAYFNSCINPILYAFLSNKFRASFRAVLCISGTDISISANHSAR